MPVSDPLAKFAESHGLAFAEHGELPQQGSILDRDSGTHN
jgi:hypothetical protein